MPILNRSEQHYRIPKHSNWWNLIVSCSSFGPCNPSVA